MKNYYWFFVLSTFAFSSCSLGDDLFGSGDAETLTCSDFDDDVRLQHQDGRSVDYIIDCLVEVDATDIVIEENTVVEFTEGSGLIIKGDAVLTIVSQVDDEWITLRGQESRAGFWKGIHIDSDSRISRILRTHISDAGDNTDSRFKGAVHVKTFATITNSTISNVEGCGLYVDNQAQMQSGMVDLEISNCSSYPVSVPIPEWDRFYVVTPPNAALYGNLEVNNCGPNKVEVRGSNTTALREVNGDIIGLDIPYQVGGVVNVPISNRLKFLPGAMIEMQEDTRIFVEGSFSVDGVSGNPAVIYGSVDEPGYWGGIHIDRPTAQTANVIEYLHILNGGGGTFENANITLKSGKYIVENCRISKSATCGLRYFENAVMLTETGNTYADNAGGGLCKD
ncbi:MAG: hypothetical protein KDC24_13460 [Saprospiraceae bacterium]|nr:hypothetical protein [Saprospiraceae bacterium]